MESITPEVKSHAGREKEASKATQVTPDTPTGIRDGIQLPIETTTPSLFVQGNKSIRHAEMTRPVKAWMLVASCEYDEDPVRTEATTND